MTFDQWMQRPVYVVQCYTFQIARSTSIFSPLVFRTIPGPWRAKGQLLRDATAAKLREMRRTCGLDRRAVRRWFDTRPASGGVAIRCDLEALLA